MSSFERARPITTLLVLGSAIVPFLGGWMPDWHTPDPDAYSMTIGALFDGFLWPVVPLAVLAFAVGTAACGIGAQAAGVRFLLGRASEEDLRPGRDWLAACARATVATGFLFGLAALGMMFLALRREANPADIARGLSMTIAWPLFALAIGRAVLAPAARAAAIRAGESERRVFSPLDDVALFVLILPAALALFSTIMQF